MRRTLVALGLLLLLLPGCRPVGRAPLVHHDTRTFSSGAGKLIRCDLRGLDLDVEVRAGESITVVVDLEVSASSRGMARRWMENHTPTFRDDERTLEITVPSRRTSYLVFGELHTRGRLSLTVPASCRLEAQATSGDIRLDGEGSLAAPVRLETSSGDLEVTGGAGELVVRTRSGDLVVHGTPLQKLSFDSTSGNLRARSACGQAVVDTASGEIRFADLGGSLSVDSGSGDVYASWSGLPGGSRLQVRTRSGDVVLDLPATVALRGQVETTSGEIRVDQPGREDSRGRRLTLSGEAGAPELEIETVSGDVRVRGKRHEPTPSKDLTAPPEAAVEKGMET